jgi:hypothetical protein
MLSEYQLKLWDTIEEHCNTAEEAIRFFMDYFGPQVLDEEMHEWLRKLDWIEEDE